MKITKEVLDTLGITKEEVLNQASKHLVESMMGVPGYTNDGDDGYTETEIDLIERMKDKVNSTLNSSVKDFVEAVIEDKMRDGIEKYIEGLSFQETTSWGEKKGESKTLKEVAVLSAETVLTRKVNGNGEHGSSYGSKDRTYAEYLIEKMVKEYVRYHITNALGTSGEAVGKIIASTVKEKATQIEKAVTDAISKVDKF